MNRQLLILAALLVVARASYAEQPDPERVKQRALQECLNNNYEKLHAYDASNLHDRSYYLEGVLLDQDGSDRRSRGLSTFVKKHTATFYTADLPFKSEQGIKYNDVFAQCMEFYHSQALNEFVTRTLLKP